jgi:hypothetical protein
MNCGFMIGTAIEYLLLSGIGVSAHFLNGSLLGAIIGTAILYSIGLIVHFITKRAPVAHQTK